ncbi:MAG: 50S ribosomal protein L25 [Brevinematia bacterium]
MAKKELTLNGELRKDVGKSASMKLREAGKLPAVLYGPEIKENIYFSLNYNEFDKVLKEVGKHHVFNLSIEKKNYKVIVKDFKIHPISRKILHVDFYAIASKKPFITEVPVNYIGTPVGVKEGGGLFIFTKKLKIEVLPEKLPDSIDVDISGLKIGQYIIVRDLPKDNYKILNYEGTTLVEVK